MDAEPYRTTVAYDALDRVVTMRYPRDVEGQRKELRPRYNRAGDLERVALDGTTFVERIAYNAKGQRTLIAYGNGVMTRYAYDPQTFGLVRLRTERYSQPEALTYRADGVALQDFSYERDLAGNITLIRDRAPECGVPDTTLGVDALDRSFAYDPLYRLLSATGRECDLPPAEPWNGPPRGADLTRARGWTERYRYDAAGNMTRLQHQANGGSFVRDLGLAPGSNRLAAMTLGQSVFNYSYDRNGNLLGEASSRHFEWDYSDRMRVYRTQAGTAEPSVHAHYLYDAGGQRVKKLVHKQGGQLATTVYVDGIFEHHRAVHVGTTRENNTLHVMDDQSRIALVRVGAPFPDDAAPAVQFQLGDHLGSSHVVMDDTGTFISREEYTPYGETGFGSFARKRYRFTGKERDEESGLNYHSARYYAPWQARWISPDPLGPVDGVNLYPYARNNPIRFTDLSGAGSDEDKKKRHGDMSNADLPTQPSIELPDDKTLDDDPTDPDGKPPDRDGKPPWNDDDTDWDDKYKHEKDKNYSNDDDPTDDGNRDPDKVRDQKPSDKKPSDKKPSDKKPANKSPASKAPASKAPSGKVPSSPTPKPPAVGKSAAKSVAKGGAKMLPLVGTIIGVGLAVERAYAGDYWGMAGEAVGAIPIIGDVKDYVETGAAAYDWFFGPPTAPAPKGVSVVPGDANAKKLAESFKTKPCPTHHPKPVPTPKKMDWSSFTLP